MTPKLFEHWGNYRDGTISRAASDIAFLLVDSGLGMDSTAGCWPMTALRTGSVRVASRV
jgi:hypothetical protein